MTPSKPFRSAEELDLDPPVEGNVRLNKFLAERGVASRRKCDELIAGGLVMVDDRIVTTLGTRIDPERAKVEVDGVVLKPQRHKRYYLLNKPKGVVCTNERREARPRAVDMIGDPDKGRIYTVGRLDEESEGLILLTSDGEFAQRVAHPRYGISKTYLVRLRGRVEGEDLERLSKGVHLAEGRTSGARLRVIKRSNQWTHLEVSISEGKNREIRRIFAAVGYKVQALKRVRIGALSDRRLKVGQWRPLLRAEVAALTEQSQPGSERPEATLEQRGPRLRERKPQPQGRRFGSRAAQHWTAVRSGNPRGTRPPKDGPRSRKP
jgi:23S rRNA pseudouridine2605 synthase